MTRYANILTDETFKVVLCNPRNKQLFMDMIELLVHKKLSDLTFLNIEQHGFAISDKNTKFDLLCKDSETGEEFIVEVQNQKQDSFTDRMLSYSTYPIRRQLARKQELFAKLANGEITEKEPGDRMDYTLRPVYVISIVNFALPHKDESTLEEGLVSRYSIREDNSGELMTDALHFIFLELGRLKIRNGEHEKCKTKLLRFAYSWRYMHLQDAIPAGFDDPLVQGLFHASEYANLTVEQQQIYDQTMTTQLDIIAQNNYAKREAMREGREAGLAAGREAGLAAGRAEGRAEGLATGRAEGLAEGLAEGKKETARNLKEMGVDPEIISKATGLSLAELEAME